MAWTGPKIWLWKRTLQCYRRRPPGRGFPNQVKTYLDPSSCFQESVTSRTSSSYLSFRHFHFPSIRRLIRRPPVHFHMPRSLSVLPHRHLQPHLLRHPLLSNWLRHDANNGHKYCDGLPTERPQRIFYRLSRLRWEYRRNNSLSVWSGTQTTTNAFTWPTELSRWWHTQRGRVITLGTYTFDQLTITLLAIFRIRPTTSTGRLLITYYLHMVPSKKPPSLPLLGIPELEDINSNYNWRLMLVALRAFAIMVKTWRYVTKTMWSSVHSVSGLEMSSLSAVRRRPPRLSACTPPLCRKRKTIVSFALKWKILSSYYRLSMPLHPVYWNPSIFRCERILV